MEREHLAAKRQFYKSNLVWENQVSFIGLAPVIKIGRSWRKPCLLMGEESMDARIWRRCTRTGFINHFGIRGTHTKANKQIELFLEMQKKVLGFFTNLILSFIAKSSIRKLEERYVYSGHQLRNTGPEFSWPISPRATKCTWTNDRM